jgi:hypothetical protein
MPVTVSAPRLIVHGGQATQQQAWNCKNTPHAHLTTNIDREGSYESGRLRNG